MAVLVIKFESFNDEEDIEQYFVMVLDGECES